jgi:stage II sporulation protein D
LTRPGLAALLVAAGSLPTSATPAASKVTTRPEMKTASLLVWRLEHDHVTGPDGWGRPLPMGSLAKPFVAKAWARSHSGAATPRFECTSASACWLPSGHGALGLAQAIASSCNAFFRALAAATPERTLGAVLREEGFLVPRPMSADTAIGGDGALAIWPGALLRAYRRLTREPWAEGEKVRAELLAGLRENALRGTARGLGRYGLWAKTGTVPAIDGRPLRTSGLTVAVDDAGGAVLGFLPDGTGREAARALAAALAPLHPGIATDDRGLARANTQTVPPNMALGTAPGRVSVTLFGGLRPRALVARNLGEHPLQTSRGFLGAGASASLRPGDRLSEGRWRLSLAGFRFHRDVVAALACDEGPGDTLQLRADMTAAEYVAGVVNAELPGSGSALRLALGQAVLRFLSDGPRHGATHVCDSTHCAWFIGRGPALSWVTPTKPVLFPRPGADGPDAAPLDAVTWEAMVRGAREPGPRQWTGHCGGRPLCAHAVWGNGDQRVWVCRRHPGPSAAWVRRWSDAKLGAAFGDRVRSMAVIEAGGVWRLAVETAAGTEALGYDDVHRRLAAALGWSALPSPATAVVREAGAWRIEGVGFGHRVGLCLGEDDARASASVTVGPAPH